MKRYAITLLAGFVLAACSSGGGSSESTSNTTAENNQNLPLITPVKPVVKALDQVPAHLQAKVKEEKLVKLPTPSHNANFYDLASSPEGWINVENVGDNITLRGYNLPYSAVGYALPQDVHFDQYGRVIDERASQENFAIVGLATQFSNLDNQGTATYNGVSFGVNSQGKMALTADFANKTVEGRLYDRTALNNQQALPEITLEKGAISNVENLATFSGVARATIDADTVRAPYTGSFMGDKAEEVNGVVLDDRGNPYEAFAGKK